jgi:hypothetical protein
MYIQHHHLFVTVQQHARHIFLQSNVHLRCMPNKRGVIVSMCCSVGVRPFDPNQATSDSGGWCWVGLPRSLLINGACSSPFTVTFQSACALQKHFWIMAGVGMTVDACMRTVWCKAH